MKRVILYFGSFNPIHRGHIALAEYVLDQDLCDQVAMVVSPRNPLKAVEGLAPEIDRFEMVEKACAASRYPEKIQASIIEFLLPRPSYTINTLEHLSQEYGDHNQFSILMGGDIIPQLSKWRDYEKILDNYPIYVYPRQGESVELYRDKIMLLDDAPLQNFSSTDVREALTEGRSVANMLPFEVIEHIKSKGLWKPKGELAELNAALEAAATAENYIARGTFFYRKNEFGKSLNDFNKALAISPDNREAAEFKSMIEEIFVFRNVDIYNP